MHFFTKLLILNCLLSFTYKSASQNRSFVVDWDHDQFLKDGEPFRFIAGSFHYFRAHPETWQRKLRTMRAAGLNAVTTYVEWSLHNPKDGTYIWHGIADLEKFVKLAVMENLLVILRPGPYICAERDMGGFPYWLLNKYPSINLRTRDTNYLYEVRSWYAELMPRLQPYLYGNGGPIIMVQVENEYGFHYDCDDKYRLWLRDETLKYVHNDAVLFTNDIPDRLRCGHIDGVLSAIDFGAGDYSATIWQKLRKIQPKGPLVGAEFYTGWLTHWSEPMQRVDAENVITALKHALDDGASMNLYMFFGGTNFGFTAGANVYGPGSYMADITSYDYDAPMNEAGDPTPKYYKMRALIGQYLPLPQGPVPQPLPKRHYGTIRLQACCSILSKAARETLATGIVRAVHLKTFEELGQHAGLVLYETFLPTFKQDPLLLYVRGLRDRAYVYADDEYVGLLSRETPIYQLPLSAMHSGKRLQILVENQGRINSFSDTDFKGILTDVLLDKSRLDNWNMTKFPLESYAQIEQLLNMGQNHGFQETKVNKLLRDGPTIFYGTLNIPAETELFDTYLDTAGWGKGVAYVNGENLGRYWPLVGPQVTLYVPREMLKGGENKIVLIEYQRAEIANEITFTDTPKLDGLK